MADISLNIGGNAEQLVSQVKQVKEDMTSLNNVTKEFNDVSTKGFKESAKASDQFKKSVKEIEAEQKKEIGLIEQINEELKQLKNARDKANDTKSIANYNKKIGETEKKLNQLTNAGKEGFDELGNAIEESGSKFGGLLDIAGGFGIALGVEALISGVIELGNVVIETVGEFRTLRGEVQQLTGLTGDSLDEVVTSAKAIAETFDVDVNEVIKSANVLSQEFGFTQEEALQKLQSGALGVAGSTEELLEQTKEYASQIRAAGGNADDLFNIINQSVEQGVFSDKGIDVVKEFGLRIREQTQGTKEALENAFGSEFTNKILKGVRDGSITSIEALEQISEKLNDTTIPADKLQTVIADVFGGPGEDAGLAYLQTLTDISGSVEDLIDQTNVLTQEQIASLEAEKRLAEAQNELSKLFDDDSGTTFFTNLKAIGFETLTTFLKPFIDLWGDLKDAFTPVFDAFSELFSIFGEAESQFSLLDVAILPLKLSLQALGFVLGLLSDAIVFVVNGIKDFIDGSPLLKSAIEGIKQVVSDVIETWERFKDLLTSGFDVAEAKAKTFARNFNENFTKPMLEQIEKRDLKERQVIKARLLRDQQEIASKLRVLLAQKQLTSEEGRILQEKFKANKEVIDKINELNSVEIEAEKKKNEEISKAREEAIVKSKEQAQKEAEERKKLLESLQKELDTALTKLATESDKAQFDSLNDEERFKAIKEQRLKEIDELEKTIKEKGQLIAEANGEEFKLTEEQIKQLEILRNQAREQELKSIAEFRAKQKDAELKALNEQLDIKEQEQLALIDTLENNGMSEQDFELFKQEQILSIQEEFANKRIALLEEEIATKEELAKADGTITIEEQNEIDRLKLKKDKLKEFVDESINQQNKLAEQRGKFSFAELLGVTDKEFDQIKDRLSGVSQELVNTLGSIIQAEQEASQERLSVIEEQISEKEEQLNTEIELNKQGFASNVESKRQELESLQRLREQEQKKQEELAKKQFILDTAVQASALITASANVLKGFSTIPLVGQILGLTQVALMVASFFATRASALAKLKAGQPKLEKGGVGTSTGMIQGRRHYQGGERFIDHIEVEDGEQWGVLSRSATRKHGKLFERFTIGLNEGKKPTDLIDDLLNGTGVMKSGINKRVRNRDLLIKEQEVILMGGAYQGEIAKGIRNVDHNLSELKEFEMAKPIIIEVEGGRYEIDVKNRKKTFIKYKNGTKK